MTISGLSDNEDYELEKYTDNNGVNCFRIKFYYEENGQKIYGLQTSEKERTITVTYRTDVDKTWIGKSDEKNYREHKNTVRVSASGTTADKDATVVVHTRTLNIKKSAKTVFTDDNGLSVIRYEVVITGIDSDSITIDDIFKKDQLIYYEDNNYKSSIGFDSKNNYKTDRGGKLSYTVTKTGTQFTISEIPKTTVGDYYPNCKLTYYMKVNGTDGLETIKSTEQGGKVTNTVKLGDLESSVSTEVAGDDTPIQKDMTEGTASNGFTATYTLTVNKDKRKYGTEDTLNVDDVMQNAWLTNIGEMKITTDPEEKAGQVTTTMDEATKTLHFIIPNETKVVIQYKAKWFGQGNVDHRNTASVYGYTTETSENCDASYGGSGTASQYKLSVYKYDSANFRKGLDGATFELQEYFKDGWEDVKANDGKTVSVTTDDKGVATLYGHQGNNGWALNPNVKYRLVETKAPDGYTPISEQDSPVFTISTDGKHGAADGTYYYYSGEEIQIADQQTSVEISKYDATEKRELEGAKLQILDENKNIVSIDGEPAEWTTSDKGSHTVKGLIAGKTYYLHEETAPEGYTVAQDIQFTIEADGTVKVISEAGEKETVEKIVMKDVQTSLKIRKTDIVDGTVLEGAKLQILDENKEPVKLGEVVLEWISGKEDKVIEGLTTGKTYYLHEETAPEGYTVAQDIQFTIEADGTVKVIGEAGEKETVEKIVMKDVQTSLKIRKTDIVDGTVLEGAKLQILDENKEPVKLGEVVLEWISGKEDKVIEGLTTGKTYYLHEETAPEGYTVAQDIQFTIEADGTVKVISEAREKETVEKIVMKDVQTSLKIRKTDIVDGTVLEGAKLQILDENKEPVKLGEDVLEWTSGKEDKVIEGLTTGKTYYLHEETAPEGYTVAADTKFVLNEDGTINVEETTATVKDGVLVVDDSMIKSEKASIEVTKTLDYNGTELGANDQTFYAALYGDENCTVRLTDVKALEFKKTASSTVKFTNLEVGRKYYVSECDAEGNAQNSGMLADSDRTAYSANFQNGNTVTVDKADDSKEIRFQNEFLKIPDGFYKVGKLKLTKKLLGADGKAKNSTDTFYAGIFDDAGFTKLSENVSQNVVALDMNNGSSAETTVDVSVVDGKMTTLYITEVDANGTPVMNSSSFTYEMTVDTDKIEFTATNTKGSITITNQEKSNEETPDDEITPSPTPEITKAPTTASPTSVPATTTANAAKTVKTGDNTPIAVFVLLLAAAVAVIAFIFIKRRKNK